MLYKYHISRKMGLVETVSDWLEEVLLLTILISSVYMFVGSFDLTYEAAVWPRYLSGGVIIGCLLLLTQNYLPPTLRTIVADDTRSFGDTKETDEKDLKDIKDRRDTIDDNHIKKNSPENIDNESAGSTLKNYSQQIMGIPNHVFTTISMGFYLLLGYLFGLLWATPIFVFMYTIWHDHDWYIVIFLVVLATGISYSFMDLMNLRIDGGVLIRP